MKPGISNGKPYARGPVGLDGPAYHKYKLHSSGQIVTGYVEANAASSTGGNSSVLQENLLHPNIP
ncbi:MAG TPA: hypothetical protein VFR24_15040 [Candidatus Angelobacter sp.]|jgi:hypothetical protein|nr:hypothetical protein [Candidatus Angelobacter sp.]